MGKVCRIYIAEGDGGMAHPVWFSKIDEFGTIIVGNPLVIALNQGVVDGIASALRAAEQDDSVKAVILMTLGRTFVAGVDVNKFRKAMSGYKRHEGLLHSLLRALEDCPKPVICAIRGFALGGGLEIAMACHYRVSAASAQIGQPEVKLGLIPGGGGTQRLPKLAGVGRAAKLCSEGDPIGAIEALNWGILDHILEEEFLPGILAFARNLITKDSPIRKTRDLAVKFRDEATNAEALAAARRLAQKRSRGQMAPLKAIDAIEAATRLSFEEGCRRENELFNECLASDQSKALIHVFFADIMNAMQPQELGSRFSGQDLGHARCDELLVIHVVDVVLFQFVFQLHEPPCRRFRVR